MKTCTDCLSSKALAEFYAQPNSADRRMNICKECHKTRVKKRRRENPDVQTYDRARAKTPERRAHSRAITIKWREDNPEKYKAETAVGNAIRDGRMNKKTTCETCASEFHVHAHHDDYSKPLDVRWLCALCHKRHHAAVADVEQVVG